MLIEDDNQPEEELEGSGTVSTIVGSTSEESGFVNVMKILEEERYCMERRLDLIAKVVHVFLMFEQYICMEVHLFVLVPFQPDR